MTVAANLLEAQERALENVWGKFLAPALLSSSIQDWLDFGLSELDTNIGEQAEAALWKVPTAYALQQMPTTTGAQTVTDVELVVEVLSRTLERIRDLTLTAPQEAAILAAYNSAWA